MRTRIQSLAVALGAALSVVSSVPAAHAQADAPRRLSFDYEVYVGGFNALKLGLDAVLDSARYDMGLRANTKGVAGWLYDWRMTAESRGEVRDGLVRPVLARGDSVSRGAASRQFLEYEDDGSVRSETWPSAESERREPVPPALREGSRDLTAAMFSALLAVGQRGRCDHSEKVFDGRRLYLMELEHAGTDMLERTDKSPYSGPATVCRLKVRMIAGKRVVDERPAEEKKMVTGSGQFATVWLAPVFQGAPLLPVRLQYDMAFGAVTVYLSRAKLTADDRPEESLAANP